MVNEGANPHRRPWGEETSERASDRREQPLDLAGEEEDRDSPISIPSARSICEPHETSRRWGQEESPSGAKCMQRETLTMRVVGSLELRSQADHTQTVCIPSSDVAFAGRNTQPVM